MAEENVEAKTKKVIMAKESDPVQDAINKVRAKRAKLRRTGVKRDVLRYPKRPGFKRRVVNDSPGRIKQFEDNGWEVVRGDETGGQTTARDPKKPGTAVTKIVGPGQEGPTTGVLMEIPEEIYNEDQKRKHDEITKNEQIMEYKLKEDSVRWKGQAIESNLG